MRIYSKNIAPFLTLAFIKKSLSKKNLTLASRSSRRQRNLDPIPHPPNLSRPQHCIHTPVPTAVPHSSSKSSDDSFTMSSSYTPATFANMATVKFHDGHKTAPILTSGDVSPAIVAQFLEYINAYFTKAKVLEVDKVKNILTSFHDIKIDHWIKNNREQFIIDTYTFEMFTTELCKRFLHPQWENTIVPNIVNSKMSPTESFVDFANRIMQGNNLLIGTESRLDSKQLRAKLDENMASYLADKIARLRPGDRERITAIEIFEDWYDEIATIDREATDDLKRIADFAAER